MLSQSIQFKFFQVLLPIFIFYSCKGPVEAEVKEIAAVENAEAVKGMVWIEGGSYLMGSSEDYAEAHEGPEIRVEVEGFFIDTTEVTNAQYARFVEATGYITVAEREVDWNELMESLPADTPKPPDSLLAPGSLVFTPPKGAVPLNDYSQWWAWVTGANRRHPEGPGSSIEGLENHPVVHIALEDAQAYCEWAGKRLPTEAEWEYAARGGAENTAFSWGEELTPEGRYLANFFQGNFPYENLVSDGYEATSPVGSFNPNGYGLYDMIGNVWEWTGDYYRPDIKAQYAAMGVKACKNPVGPEKSFDPNDPYAADKRVLKGGSFLCSDQYCSNYRPSSRMPSSYDSGQNHLGFRCVRDR